MIADATLAMHELLGRAFFRKFASPVVLASSKTLAMFHILMGGVPKRGGACESMRLSPCVLVQPDGWARGEREGYGEPCDVTSLSLLNQQS